MATSNKLSTALNKAKEKKEVPPDLQTVLLIEIGESLVEISELQGKILHHLEETTPEGIDYPIDDVTVTSKTVINFEDSWPFRRLRSIDPVHNKGPNTAWIQVNEEARNELKVESQEDITIVKPKPAIKYVTIRVLTGSPTTIRMIGHR